MVDPRAGTLAQPSDLVDVAHLLTAYYTLEPDPDDVDQQVAFGTSGHRGSSLDTAFNEVHIAATTQAICDYRKGRGTTARCSSAATPTGCRSRRGRQRSRSLIANDVTVMVDDRDGLHPNPGGVARDHPRERRAYVGLDDRGHDARVSLTASS